AGPDVLGDWLAGLFALARQEVLDPDGTVLGVLDELLGDLTDGDFQVALPALRQAFGFFPPREREAIAEGLLERRGLNASARTLLRAPDDPLLIAEARALEERVDRALAAAGLLEGES
uniref:PRC-barrel domain-containing protein n=1 Tax=Actinomadura geliboluensis TaxID=882440 RepID=UPI00261687B2